MHRAVMNRMYAVARFALLVGVLVPAPVLGAPDLHAAVRSGSVDEVRLALKSGAAIDAADRWGRTPLIVALQQGRQPVVEALVAAGADVRRTDAWGRTPLLVATQLKNTPAVRLLVQRKSELDAANRNDITPLIAAAQTGNHEAAAVLLAAGAGTERADNLGWTALAWAKARDDQAMVALLLRHGASQSTKPRAQPPAGATASLRTVQPVLDTGRLVRGNPTAAITIVEYTDFQCPYCARGSQVLEEVLARYEGQVRVLLKHLPLEKLHPMAMSSARFFEALALQDPQLAWRFHDRVFADQKALAGGEASLRSIAQSLGADVQRLDRDLASPLVRERIAADLQESERFQFDGVPAFAVNGRVIEGAQPAIVFFRVIDGLLGR